MFFCGASKELETIVPTQVSLEFVMCSPKLKDLIDELFFFDF